MDRQERIMKELSKIEDYMRKNMITKREARKAFAELSEMIGRFLRNHGVAAR